MRFILSIAVAGLVIANAAGATAGELPSYEARSFPISPVQVQVLGAADVAEQSPAATLTVAGMPASPAQIAVLTPHRKQFASTEH